MVKKILAVLSILLTVGCSDFDTNGGTVSGSVNIRYVCIDGVEYIIFKRGYGGFLAPHYNADGSLNTCRIK